MQRLNPREFTAYHRYAEAQGYPIAPDTALKMYGLYVQGYNLEEIQRLNPGFQLGAVVRAYVDYGWHERRQAYLDTLLAGVESRVQQTQLETVKFACDGLAVFHKLAGERFKRFLQTGDPKDLGDWKDMSLRNYKEFLETVLKATGQDVQKVKADVLHRVEVQEPQALDSLRPMTPEQAAAALALLEKKD